MKRVLVTGAAGFLGRHALPALRARGFEIHALGRTRPADPGVVLHRADLLDAGSRRDAVRSVAASHLLHLAWTTEPGRYWQAPENLDWVGASLDLVRCFREAGGARAVVAGSCAEYDWSAGETDRPLRETGSPCRPATLYGTAKDGLRRILDAYAASAGLSLAWGRIFYLYGPGERPGRLVGDAVRALLSDRTFATSEGRQARDFLHVADAGAAFAALLDGDVRGPVNVGSGEAPPVRTLLERIGALTRRSDLIAYGARPFPAGEPARIVADVTRLREEVGFAPAFDLDAGLADTVTRFSSEASGP